MSFSLSLSRAHLVQLFLCDAFIIPVDKFLKDATKIADEERLLHLTQAAMHRTRRDVTSCW